jgi:hypothetical protein
VGGEDDRDIAANVLGELGECLADVLDHRLDESGVIVEDAELIDLGCAGAGLFTGSRDVIEVLAAARIRTVGGGDESERPLDAVLSHLTQRVDEQGMPVAIAPVDGELRPSGGEFTS